MKTEQETRAALSRRDFLKRISLVAAAGTALAACAAEQQTDPARQAAAVVPPAGNELSCSGGPALSPAERQRRHALQYVDASPHPEKRCSNCRFFVKPGSGKPCGLCKVVPGPVHPKGYCLTWAAA